MNNQITMNSKLLKDLTEKLESQKNALQKELGSFAREDKNSKGNWDTKYPAREDADKDEAADEAQEYDTMISLEHSLEVKLKDVNLALEKIKEGKYGICEKCGKEIEEARLEAIPEARTCMKDNKR